MNYKTYAEAKIANPDCEIVTTTILHSEGGNYEFLPVKFLNGNYESQIDSRRPNVRDGYWVICNPADYCSTLKEFLDAEFKLVEGDKFIGISGHIVSVKNTDASNMRDDEDDEFRYILSAEALNGGCKIPNAEVNKVNYTIEELRGKYVKVGTPECEVFLTACANIGVVWSGMSSANNVPENAEFIGISLIFSNGKTLGHSREKYWVKRGFLPFNPKDNGCILDANLELAESWTIYNNTLPLSELSDELDVKLFRAWRNGGEVQFLTSHNEWVKSKYPFSEPERIYRIKPKSERELFIENTTKVMRDAGTKCPDNHEYFGIMFDAGARYTDLTQSFGENI